MPKLDRLPEAQRQSILTLAVEEHETAPFHRPVKPLSAARVAIVTTAGVHERSDKPFRPSDPSYREIPSSVAVGDLLQTHTSIGFDRTSVMADINVVFPLERLREMVAEGAIGELAPRFFSFMGAQRDVVPIRTTTAPEVAAKLRRRRRRRRAPHTDLTAVHAHGRCDRTSIGRSGTEHDCAQSGSRTDGEDQAAARGLRTVSLRHLGGPSE